MGNLPKTSEFKVLFGGLDASGKTTILYRLKLGQVVTSVPTIGFNVEEIIVNGNKLVLWDLGGAQKIRQLHHHYLTGMNGFIYVIDISDVERFQISMDQLWKYYLKYMDVKIPILMFMNKCDFIVDNHEKIKQLIKHTTKGRKVFITPCIALTGAGLIQGIQWLIKQMEVINYKML